MLPLHRKFKTTYNCWINMRQRCRDQNIPNYKYYGGRGIRVCKRWESFKNFLKDMGEKPEGLSLDRINNNGDYKPSNCRWATHFEQMNNRRNNITLTLNGRKQTIRQWAKELGLKDTTILWRRNHGWNDWEILTTPVKSSW